MRELAGTRVPAVPDAVPRARHALDRLSHVIPADILENMRLLVSELVTNSVRHASLGRDDPIQVTVAGTPTGYRVDVLDPGPGFDPPRPDPSPDGDAGWGLFLVARLADRWGVERGEGTRVWFELDRR